MSQQHTGNGDVTAAHRKWWCHSSTTNCDVTAAQQTVMSQQHNKLWCHISTTKWQHDITAAQQTKQSQDVQTDCSCTKLLSYLITSTLQYNVFLQSPNNIFSVHQERIFTNYWTVRLRWCAHHVLSPLHKIMLQTCRMSAWGSHMKNYESNFCLKTSW